MPDVSTRLDRVAADAMLVTVAGTIGTLEADDVRAALDEALAGGARRIVVDLSDARVDESEALAALLAAARVVGSDGIVALVANRSTELRQILVTTGLEPAFALYESLRAALDDLDLDDPPA